MKYFFDVHNLIEIWLYALYLRFQSNRGPRTKSSRGPVDLHLLGGYFYSVPQALT